MMRLLTSVSILPMSDGTVAVARVIWVTADGTEHLTGSAEVRDDPRFRALRPALHDAALQAIGYRAG